MGTRNLTCVVVDGEYKVSQYCQWDGYPKGQGSTILDFLSKVNIDALREKVKDLHGYTDEEIEKIFDGYGNGSAWLTLEESDRLKQEHPELHRDTGAMILEMIMLDDYIEGVHNNLEFARDSLFCEWAYVIDLDKNTFEVYRGFNKEPLRDSERFSSMGSSDNGYYPVKHFVTFDLDKLPPTAEKFVHICEEIEKKVA